MSNEGVYLITVVSLLATYNSLLVTRYLSLVTFNRYGGFQIGNRKLITACILNFVFCVLAYSVAQHAWGEFVIVQSNEPLCSLVVPENPSIREKLAVEELVYFVEKFTGAKLAKNPDSQPLPEGNVILIGTSSSNRYIIDLYNKDLISSGKDLGEEEFIVKTVYDRGRDFLVILGRQDAAVIYGVYALIERMIETINKQNPVDLDFHVSRTPSLVLETLDIQSAPFYLAL